MTLKCSKEAGIPSGSHYRESCGASSCLVLFLLFGVLPVRLRFNQSTNEVVWKTCVCVCGCKSPEELHCFNTSLLPLWLPGSLQFSMLKVIQSTCCGENMQRRESLNLLYTRFLWRGAAVVLRHAPFDSCLFQSEPDMSSWRDVIEFKWLLLLVLKVAVMLLSLCGVRCPGRWSVAHECAICNGSCVTLS